MYTGGRCGDTILKLSRVLVPVAGDGPDEDALILAGTLARRFRATVVVIYVIEVKRALPIDAEIEPEIEKGERILDQAEQVISRTEALIDTELLQARDIGAAIV